MEEIRMKYCSNCGKQLQDNEQCTCSDSLVEASETTASTQEGVVTESEDFFNHYFDADAKKVDETSVNNQEFQSQESYQYGQESQSQDQGFQENSNAFKETGPTPNSKQGKGTVLKTALKNVFPFIKASIKTPGNTLHTSAENTDLPLAGIFYVAYCCSWILFLMLAFSKLANLVSGMSYLILGFTQSYVKISYFYAALIALIISLIFVVVTNLFMICLGFITHSKYNFKQIIAASAGIFVFPTICFLLASILIFISIPISICVLIVGNIAYMILFFYTGKTLFQKNDNSSFLWVMILLTAVLSIITTFCTFKVSLSFSSKLVRTESSFDNLFGNDYDDSYDDYDDSYDDYDDWYNFDEFFE